MRRYEFQICMAHCLDLKVKAQASKDEALFGLADRTPKLYLLLSNLVMSVEGMEHHNMAAIVGTIIRSQPGSVSDKRACICTHIILVFISIAV